jgi:multidrug efflux pump subunit AcrA (membrane-fusion protein)
MLRSVTAQGGVAVQIRRKMATTAKKGDFDSGSARLDAAIADAKAAEGEVERLQALQQFKQLTAPFDGIVTERNTDIGALINAGSGVGGGTGPVLFAATFRSTAAVAGMFAVYIAVLFTIVYCGRTDTLLLDR